MAEYKDITSIKEQIAHVKRNVKSENSAYLIGYISALSTIEGMIASLPKADVEPVRHGHWINENFYTRCSVCGKMAIYDKYGQEVESDYCPNCGAKMDGESND